MILRCEGFILSPNEGFENGSSSTSVGDFQLINTSNQEVFDYTDPPGVAQPVSPDICSTSLVAGGFNGVAEDCTTGIAVATVEFTDQLYLVDLTQATFDTTAKTWSPNGSGSFISIPEVRPYMCDIGAGTDGAAIAPNSHLGVITGEYGDNHIIAIKLPNQSGNGAPTLQDYAFAPIPNTPDGHPWQHGTDPHTVTAYWSAGIRRAFAILEDDAFADGTRTYLAVVDLQGVLDATRSGHTVTSLSSCTGMGSNPSGCLVRFVKVGVNAVGPSAALASPLP